MKLFEGKSRSERNKMIAAIVLGVLSLAVLYYAFFAGSSSGRTSAGAKPTPTPTRGSATQTSPSRVEMPSEQDQMLDMTTQPIVYNASVFGVRDPGRNIFAFYEPPKPTPYQPTPMPVITPPPATPAPTPEIQIASMNPSSIYAGSNGFRIEIAGDRFTQDTKIYFDQQELPSTFVSEQRMTVDVPSVLIRNDGRRNIMAQTADGVRRSNIFLFDVQPPPRPQFQYVGMIARTRSNNDTAYFQESGKPLPTSARLNDVVGGRFRLMSISSAEVVLEDVNLGFRHRLALFVPPPPPATAQPPAVTVPGRGLPNREGFAPVNPNPQDPSGMPPQGIPGIPANVPRIAQPPSNTNRIMPANTKREVQDDDDGRK